ncbi:response regulator [Bacillus sp. B1-b2]|uniref:response regulator n=1 Tax=Bacillus sp. B1-b2 TaxID=2653201 RepID=UPI001261E73F|nr:response regulator [Bacillus sp. B1-b2]KAB7672656.1 response regulator [Bacillus sp. B1-b2]
MVKLLIVDDEQVERDGMQAILTKGFPNISIKQAKNGNMAIQMAESFEPDLILMDIKMPGISGLEAVQRISSQNSHIRFIMVTAYDTFEFMRQAIKLGVKDYILKPSKATEIYATIKKVLDHMEKEQRAVTIRRLQQETMQKTFSLVETDVVTQLLFDHVHEIHVDMLVEMLDTPSTNEMFVMLVSIPGGTETIYSAIKEEVRQTKSCWIGALYGSYLPIIVFRDLNMSYRSQAILLAKSILSVLLPFNNENGFIGIGSVSPSLDIVRQSYHEALLATMDSKLQLKYRFYSDEAIVNNHTFQEGLVEHRKKEFADQIRMGQWEKIRNYILSIIKQYESQSADLMYTQQRVLEILWIASQVMNEMGMEADTPLFTYKPTNYRQLELESTRLLNEMILTFKEKSEKIEVDAIHQLKQYILTHSKEDISLESLARKVGLSPIYISKIFKEKQGINYIDYLTECRIEKARILIRDTDKSIKEITFEVGYHDPNYFSKVFKKLCHMSPKEYRKSFQVNKV